MGQNVIIFRRSKTKYGRKWFVRVLGYNGQFRYGKLPWAKNWVRPFQLKRVKNGFKGNVKFGARSVHWQIDKVVKHKRRGRRVLECPNCGYQNYIHNFWRRVKEDEIQDVPRI